VIRVIRVIRVVLKSPAGKRIIETGHETMLRKNLASPFFSAGNLLFTLFTLFTLISH
jgi:hypothetical protein